MTRPHPFRSAIMLAAGVLALVALLQSMYHLGVSVAHADTPTPAHAVVTAIAHVAPAGAPDPIDAAGTAAESTWSSIETYGPLWGGALLLFAGVGAFLRRNAAAHWLAQGRALAAITTSSMLLAAVLTWRFRGGDTGGLLMSVLLAIKMLVSPTVAPPAAPTPSPTSELPTAPAKAPQSGRARMVVIGMLAAIAASIAIPALLTTSCTAPQRAAAEHALWDCTSPARADAVAAITPAVISVIKAAGSADGKLIDMSTVRSAISKANLLTEAGVLLSCAAASAFAILSAPAAEHSFAAGTGRIDPAVARAAWAQLDAEQFGGARFVTSAGVQ